MSEETTKKTAAAKTKTATSTAKAKATSTAKTAAAKTAAKTTAAKTTAKTTAAKKTSGVKTTTPKSTTAAKTTRQTTSKPKTTQVKVSATKTPPIDKIESTDTADVIVQPVQTESLLTTELDVSPVTAEKPSERTAQSTTQVKVTDTAAETTTRKPKTLWMTLAALATAGIVLAVLILAPGAKIPLEQSSGVKVTSASVIPKGSVVVDLLPQSETDMLTGVDIFTGDVTSIESIKVSFSDWSAYQSILTIQVASVVRGDLVVGDEVRVLISPAVGMGCDNCEAHSMLRTSSHVLMLATPAAEGNAQALDGTGVFHYSDVADYYLSDPIRTLFVDYRRSVGEQHDSEFWSSLSTYTFENVDDVAAVIARMI